MNIKKKIFDFLERYSSINGSFIDPSYYYYHKNGKYIVMDPPYDILRGVIILLAVVTLFSSWFITFVVCLCIYFILTFIKRNSLIYKVIRYFQYESDYADAEDIINYVRPRFFLTKNGYGDLIRDVSYITDTLWYKNKIDISRGNGIEIYRSRFSGPFKKTSIKEEIR